MTESKPLPTIDLDGVTWRPYLITTQPRGLVSFETKAMTTEHLALLLKAMPRDELATIITELLGGEKALDWRMGEFIDRGRRADLAEAALSLQSPVIEAALAVRAWARDGRAFVPNCVSSLGDALDEAEAKLREMEGK